MADIGKIWPSGQTPPSICFYKHSFTGAQSHSFVHKWSVAAFMLNCKVGSLQSIQSEMSKIVSANVKGTSSSSASAGRAMITLMLNAGLIYFGQKIACEYGWDVWIRKGRGGSTSKQENKYVRMCELTLHLIHIYVVYIILFDDGLLPRERERLIHPNPDC